MALRLSAPAARPSAARSASRASRRGAAAPRAPSRASPACGAAIKTREGAELRDGIASFYDASTPVWDDVWGEHLHHGYYPGGKARKDHQQAQVDMVDNVLEWAGVSSVKSVLDIGCGIGGSTRHIARKYGAKGTGITLSPVQVGIAQGRTAAAGLRDVSFQVADALKMPFADNSFDLVWSLESGEHMPDKAVFMSEMVRVAQPGGRIILVTWCIRALRPDEADYSDDEKTLLSRICDAYYLPQWCAIDKYAELATDLRLQGLRTADWSAEVQPFWRAVIDTVFSWRGFFGLLKSGPKTIQGASHVQPPTHTLPRCVSSARMHAGALVMPLMQQGLRRGLIKFNLLTGTKPL